MTRRAVISLLAATIVLLSAVAASVRSFFSNPRGVSEFLVRLRSRAVLWSWMTQSMKLFIGTLAYNAFALIVVQPLLRRWFPPLKPWEHVTGLFGGARLTYEEIVPAVATTLWIAGNAMLFALMNRNLRGTQAAIATGGAMTPLDARPRAGR
jgi:hypothetical protein